MAKCKVMCVWDELTDVNYLSPSPNIKYGFRVPQAMRADTDPRYNNQPWYNRKEFAQVDPSQTLFPVKKG